MGVSPGPGRKGLGDDDDDENDKIISNKNGDDDGSDVMLVCHLKPNIVLPKVAQIAHVAHVAQVKDCNTDDDSSGYHLKTNILLAEWKSVI